MRNFLFAVVIAALFAFVPASALAATRSPSFSVSGWIPYWNKDAGIADAIHHLDVLTDVMPFSYTMNADGSMKDSFGLGSATTARSAAATKLIAAAKKQGVRVVPTISWSDGAAVQAILSNQATRTTLESAIATLVQTQGFDGIDIDFESKQAATKDYFSLFLKELDQRLGKKLLYCTVEARTPVSERYSGTVPRDATVYANDYAAIGTYCDRVEVMAYDQQTVDVKLNALAAPDTYIPVADPRWVESVMNLTAASITKDKLTIGIATYGYEWSATPTSATRYSYAKQWSVSPAYATALAKKLHIRPERNAAGELSFTYDPTTKASKRAVAAINKKFGITADTSEPPAGSKFNVVWWSDAEAASDKVALARSLGISGVSFFKLDGNEDQDLWDAVDR